MQIHSSCRDCGGPLLVTNLGHDTVHPTCTPKPSRIETLVADWLTAAADNDSAKEHTIEARMTEIDQRPPRLLDAALMYAGWGWPVFPLRAGTKTPATRHGFKDATTDVDRVRAWWERHPDHNVGLPTGHRFDVIDFDTPDGAETLGHLCQLDGDVHGWVATASAGVHLYISPNPGMSNMTRFRAGTDYRAAGGYVVAPPSRLADGSRWTWIHHPSPEIKGR